MYSTTTAIASISALGTDTGSLISQGVFLALAGGVALLGLGFAWRAVSRYIIADDREWGRVMGKARKADKDFHDTVGF